MPSRFLLPLLAATSLTCPAFADDHATAWRLFIADHAAPTVTALDLETGDTLDTFTLAGPASLYTTDGAVFAVQGSANQVAAIDSGIALEDHGDHGDIAITEPRLIEATLAGEKPAHFVEHGGKVALFHDGSGKVDLFSAHDWVHRGEVATTQVDSGTAHHGVAVPWGDYTLVSSANADDEKKPRIGLNVLDKAGNLVGETHACPDLHGEATSGNLVIIGCSDGVLIASGSGEPRIEKITYDGLPDGKSTTFLGGVGMQYFLGNYGADRVAIIDPAEDKAFRLVDLPTRRMHFAVDPAQPKFAYIFTEDGKLNQLDVIAGEITHSLAVTEPYSMDGDWALPRPRIAVAGDLVAVTDPNEGKVHLIDVESFAETGTLDVNGAPFNIVAVGGSGAVH
ncbi:MAG: zinc metallochaperone AztD [Candidatus Devosia phytovorans]|uniref:Zinc metallochaperone AztD n=1 Tax=Candidatus Devosia phytovorans TaxID=3121372 RepID=A0AAJ5VQZ8_9HYPH|nr:zinc metallochaperone AztD [Devosia sp.]WEK03131.1 MAG: zinc metallochaperone AztD [Devosia sp.]